MRLLRLIKKVLVYLIHSQRLPHMVYNVSNTQFSDKCSSFVTSLVKAHSEKSRERTRMQNIVHSANEAIGSEDGS
jgi:hypothetical protein